MRKLPIGKPSRNPLRKLDTNNALGWLFNSCFKQAILTGVTHCEVLKVGFRDHRVRVMDGGRHIPFGYRGA